MKEADKLRDQSEYPFIIETINYTIAHDNKNKVHHNMYFTWTLTDAIKLATNLIIESLDVAEEVVDIRPATREEIEKFNAAYDKLIQSNLDAILD
jgi:hypothetical protein